MTAPYYTLLTNIGAAKLANATATDTPLNITQMGVGDANGTVPTPDPGQTSLIHECRRADLNTLKTDPNNPNQIIAEQVLPDNVGGWYIRELGLYDADGDLIAVGNCPPSYKPLIEEGASREQVIRMILIVTSDDAVTLKIDPAVVLATREYVDDSIEAHAKSRNHPDATTKAKGFVQLSSETDSDDETKAATPKAVKSVKAAADAAVKTVNTHKPDSSGNVKLGSAADADIVTSMTDTTAGRVPVVGYGGWGIANGTTIFLKSIFDIACSGVYNALGKGNKSPTEGMPDDSGNTRYAVLATNVYASLYWVTLISNREYYVGNVDVSKRTAVWNRFYCTGYKPTAADTGALPLTGGTMTGLTTFTVNGECIRLKNDSATMSAYLAWYDNDNTRLGHFGRGGANKDMTWVNQAAGSAIYLPENGAVQINTKGNSSPIVLNGITQSLYYKATGRPGAGSFASQFTQLAPFYHEFSSASTSEYDPLWKQKHIDGNTMWSGGMLVSAENFVFQYIKSDGTNTTIALHPSGQVLPGSYANFDARYPTLFRVGARIKVGNLHATGDWSGKVPQGALSIASLTEGDDRITSMYYAYPQYLINGKWVNFA